MVHRLEDILVGQEDNRGRDKRMKMGMPEKRRNKTRKIIRRGYYNIFSHVYDTFVRLHSGDSAQRLRRWLIETVGLEPGMNVLDLCTGTGSVAITARRAIGDKGLVVGLDFSEGMLRRAYQKSYNIAWIQADVTELPFKDNSLDAVFCAYGFYELKHGERTKVLEEVCRILVPEGKFLMMEHEVPMQPFIRFLYRIRLVTLGSLSSEKFIKKEMEIISGFFGSVMKEKSPSGNSKIIMGQYPKRQKRP